MRMIGPAPAAVLAVLVTLMFYQVGFAQYHMVLFVLASYWMMSCSQSDQRGNSGLDGAGLLLRMAFGFRRHPFEDRYRPHADARVDWLADVPSGMLPSGQHRPIVSELDERAGRTV